MKRFWFLYSHILLIDMIKLEAKLVKEAHVLFHPLRFRIVELLAEKPRHINEISRALKNEKRRLVTYHLHILEEHGLVDSKYEISDQPKLRGKALRIYQLTGKVDEIFSALKK